MARSQCGARRRAPPPGIAIVNVAEFKRVAADANAPRELGSLARAIASEPVAQAISPVVLIGLVRLAELLGIAATGAVACALTVPDEIGWAYPAAILLVSGAAVFSFQIFEIYSIPAFRSHVHQLSRLALAWTLVFLVAF